jgi:hypothetical protein
LWSTGETTPKINNLCQGYTYSVTVVDTEGCVVSGSFAFGNQVVYPDSLIGYWKYQQDDMDFIFNLPVYSDSVYCEWDFGDGQTATGSMVNHTYTDYDNYTVRLKVTDKSGNILYNGQIPVSAGEVTGLNKTESQAPLVYPVPASEILYLKFKDSGEIAGIEILNSVGRKFEILSVNDISDGETTLDISTLPQGLYLGRVKTRSGFISTFKFIKQ